MKHIHSMLSAALFSCLLFTATSCIHQGDLNLDPVPDIAFQYTSNGLTLTFKPATDGVSNVSWTSSDGGTGTGDSYVHTFSKPAIYWVSMTGSINGKEQYCATKVVVAKAALVSMNDNTFDDWKKVTYPDFQFTGQEAGVTPVICGKADYDANYVYFYIEFSNTLNPEVNADKAIFSFKCDSNADKATGHVTSSIGADYLMEGNITGAAPWYDFYTGASGDWVHIDDANWVSSVMVLGHREVTASTTKIEWAYKLSNLGITSNSFRFVLSVYTGGWDDADFMMYNGDKKIVLDMNKE